MKLVPIDKLFTVKHGNSLELINLDECPKDDPEAINYVSRTENNNGISAFVKRNADIPENPANTISVAASGSVLSSFLQPEPYYTGFHVFVLSPIKAMTTLELLFYCQCLRANKYKYNYGRQANRTLKSLLVPESLPTDFKKIKVDEIALPNRIPMAKAIMTLDIQNWRSFTLDNLFDIKKGKRLTKEDIRQGTTPFIGAIDSNNGYREFVGQDPIHEGNTITVNYNGSVAEAFYQPVPFWASDDVNVLYPKFKLNIYIALFIITIIEREKYRFNFGRKWHKERMDKSVINLPAINNAPNFMYMEKYIKSLNYSTAILDETSETKVINHTIKGKNKTGLSDQELIEKYESGTVPMKKVMKAMLKTKPPEKAERK